MNGSTAQARVIVDELVRSGVTDAVLCPGSRNAPPAFALARADELGLLRLHVRIDERTAGFLALGLATASGRPVPVVVTSGTAVANLHPAMLEASHAGVPLLALTADRPPELVGTGASQTIAQSGIFGAAVRWSGSLAVPAGGTGAAGVSEAEVRRWRSGVARALAAATGGGSGPPGPVQLDLPYAEPLVPDPDGDDPQPDGAGLLGPWIPAGRPGGAAWTVVPRPARALPPLPLDPAARTLVIGGSGGPRADPALLGGAPLAAEPSSPWWPHALRAAPWLLDRPELRPSQVVVLGRPTLHRAVAQLLADPDVAVYADPGPDGASWTDVPGTVRAVGALPALDPPDAFAYAWSAADRAAAKALDAALDGDLAAGAPGLRLARDLVAAQPDGAQLVLGSSNPVRDVALAAAPRDGLVVRSNRGVAGIDGTVSTAIGAALAHDGPTTLLLGDLTLLHDTTGLVVGRSEPVPDLTVVVLDDDGGGIFHLLEQGGPEHATAFERVFGTPTGADLIGLARALGWVAVDWSGDRAELAARAGAGRRLVRVAATRSGLRDAHAALAVAVGEAMA
ncbi:MULTISPECIES: 2-succinyl-5-enolpyruvyl-6-hydroxy-3-cyclohexene-1-carboxylic-acid synthase [Pseudonocardia]|uniref:2-succinyl-5-enolpyruvyl-6-hydroxy-3-cyclohexene-1-carboxylate synthase n=2 Tax=Pseudonocardia TaxID=1847 RepID=A0A1Y2N9T7_PSEAH|nr:MULTISPECIES: 2-succinyl-5-enolpyruvyl-6-hydroxy-3-cyclohexene-1-carboxylic-acid synthase [Pseudonocardia]OSY44222.1 2-succinyl-5-enolpyruvyl-6-hydroxy-3-cyclohexene-1-carboxylate synthase [Pseudonocardia autotrophica]TDN74048.1 2-succinyl-5-enolpyruvyl-6-hydroxy-3-cyclohexene-1-carboxylate synthase [Pseudonocardia autotrophica]BBG04805.1 2-succinyl-5-enolpyruvyl-6-hydroxy-3-cyclohexene- 1-carboxylate synthase [Pseudonocardia autotrophica]GEC23461.1 2-succinyl-5-enolpyruvyl-6-hydroxy-3-cyclo